MLFGTLAELHYNQPIKHFFHDNFKEDASDFAVRYKILTDLLNDSETNEIDFHIYVLH